MQLLLAMALSLGFVQGQAPRPAASVGVMDGAKMFSASSVKDAEGAISNIRKATGWQTVVETVETLGGKEIADVSLSRVKALDVRGVYILISKSDKKFYVRESERARHTFDKKANDKILASLRKNFQANQPDAALLESIETIRQISVLSRATDERVGVRDNAKMFSQSAIEQADEILLGFHRDTNWQVVIETVDSLGGQTPKARAVADAAKANIRGLFVLIAKAEQKIEVEPSKSAEAAFPKAKCDALVATITGDFKARKFDKGLVDAANQIRKIVLPNGLQVSMMPGERGTDGPAPASVDAPKKRSNTSTSGKSGGINGQVFEGEPGQTKAAGGDAANAEANEPAKPNYVLYIALGLGALTLLFLVGRMFKSPQPNAATQGQAPPAPSQPAYLPQGTPQPQAGYGYGPSQPQQRPMPPGYGPQQPGYGPQQPGYGPGPGYAQGGYAQPPASGGGGFVSGALGGLGGAIAGNILYDKFGRPHHGEGHVDNHSHTQGHVDPQVNYNPEPSSVSNPPHETYDPNAGAGGSWDTPDTAQAPAPDQWSGGAGGSWAGGDAPAQDPGSWAAAPEPPDQGSWAEAQPSGAGGGWDAPAAEPAPEWSDQQVADNGGGGDWGSNDPAPDVGGGGDWGGDAPAAEEQGDGGGW